MNRVFVDMDGVIVDFDAYKRTTGLTGDEIKRLPGSYLAMPPIPGAIAAVRALIGMGYDVWIATKPPTGVSYAYSDKAQWIFQNIPELKRKIIITHDKGLLGDEGDYLCDDRPHKANCEAFKGTLIRFVGGYHWPEALKLFGDLARSNPVRDPVHQEDGFWYFWDETWSDRHGPFDSEWYCRERMERYVTEALGD